MPLYQENNMSGGGARIMPSYEKVIVDERDKAIKEELKEAMPKVPYKGKQEETKLLPSQKKNTDDLMFDLKVFNPSKPPPRKDPIKQKMMNLPGNEILFSTPYVPSQFQNYMNQQFDKYAHPFIYKDYNINLNGLNTNHIMAQRVFEDILPPDDIYSSFKSLRERNVLCDYIRSTFITNDDGEHKDFSGGKESLNSRLNLIELTPFMPHNLTNNKYKNRPKNMLMYSSCYPIKYNEKTKRCDCADKHTIMNVRVYNLTNEEYTYFNPNNLLSNGTSSTGSSSASSSASSSSSGTPTAASLPIDKSSNIIRELKYFQFMRQKINKDKYCPNFICSYCYFISKDCNVNFNNEQITNNKYDSNGCLIQQKKKTQMCLIILTEGPDFNIYTWASNRAQMDRNLVKQVGCGYKTNEMWDNVLFQIIIVFYTMWQKKFTYKDMKLNNNFYIKSFATSTANPKYFKYVVEQVEYYIQNTGYLLLCNTDNHDITEGENVCKILSNTEFNDDVNNIENIIMENAKRCLAIDSFKAQDLVSPSQEILDKIVKINNLLNNSSVSNLGSNIFETILLTNFNNFINDRIGTHLKGQGQSQVDETRFIIQDNFTPKKGDLCVRPDGDMWKICMFIKSESPGSGLFIIEKGSDAVSLPISSMYSIGSSVNIQQQNNNLSVDNLEEIYYIN